MLQTVPVLMALAALLIYYPLDPQLLSGFERDPSPTPNTGHLDNVRSRASHVLVPFTLLYVRHATTCAAARCCLAK